MPGGKILGFCIIDEEESETFSLSFQVLYIHRNRLKKLPESLGNLTKLQSLDASSNNLKELPSSLGKLVRLRTLDVTKNAKLAKVPKQLGQMRACEKLLLDAKGFQYPSAEICAEGTEAIMRFLSKGKSYILSTHFYMATEPLILPFQDGGRIQFLFFLFFTHNPFRALTKRTARGFGLAYCGLTAFCASFRRFFFVALDSFWRDFATKRKAKKSARDWKQPQTG